MPRRLRINIFEYLDYRKFLRAAYDDLKANQTGFSYRWFARRAGMSAPNFLKLVIEGQRNLTLASADRFARALDLNTQEAAFLRELVGFAHASTPAEKNRHYGNLSRYRQHRTVRRLERDAFEYLSRWYYPVIRELVACDGFVEDPQWIAQALRPRITPAQARKALTVLLELGLLARDGDGRLHQGEPIVSTGPEVRSLAVGNFHRQMMQRAADSIETVASPHREISGVTIAISQASFAMFKSKIQALRAEILEIAANERAPTRVMQLNFQLFPLAQSQEEP